MNKEKLIYFFWGPIVCLNIILEEGSTSDHMYCTAHLKIEIKIIPSNFLFAHCLLYVRNASQNVVLSNNNQYYDGQEYSAGSFKNA